MTWDQLSHAEHETYYEKYDVFYSGASDAPATFVPVSGRRDGDLLILSSDPIALSGRHDLTIRVDGDNWQFASYLPNAEGYKLISDGMMRNIERYFENFYNVAVLGAELDERLDLGTILYNEFFYTNIHIDDWRFEVSGGEMSIGEMFEAMHRLREKAESLRDARGQGTVYEDLELSFEQTDGKFHTAHSATMWVDVEVSYTDAVTGQRLSSQTSYAIDFIMVTGDWYIVNITEETGKVS